MKDCSLKLSQKGSRGLCSDRDQEIEEVKVRNGSIFVNLLLENLKPLISLDDLGTLVNNCKFLYIFMVTCFVFYIIFNFNSL